MEAEIKAQIPGIDQVISEYASVSCIYAASKGRYLDEPRILMPLRDI